MYFFLSNLFIRLDAELSEFYDATKYVLIFVDEISEKQEIP